METAKERLKAYIDTEGISLQEFYETTGLKRGLLDTDKLHQAISSDRLATISESYPAMNIAWVVTGEGDMYKRQVRAEGGTTNSINNVAGKNSYITATQTVGGNDQTAIAHIMNENKQLIESIKEKDKQIQEKDKQIQEKDDRITHLTDRLLECLSSKK